MREDKKLSFSDIKSILHHGIRKRYKFLEQSSSKDGVVLSICVDEIGPNVQTNSAYILDLIAEIQSVVNQMKSTPIRVESARLSWSDNEEYERKKSSLPPENLVFSWFVMDGFYAPGLFYDMVDIKVSESELIIAPADNTHRLGDKAQQSVRHGARRLVEQLQSVSIEVNAKSTRKNKPRKDSDGGWQNRNTR